MITKNKLLLLFGAVIVFTVGYSVVNYLSSQRANVNIIFQLPDTNNIEATINGKSFIVSSLNATYTFHNGDKHLSITKNGYKPFSTDFTVEKGHDLVIVVSMQLKNPASDVKSSDQLEQSLSRNLPSGFTIKQVSYFYENTWAVALLSLDENSAILVAKRSLDNGLWQTVLGPGTSFGDSDVVNLPRDVNAFMYQRRYVLPGGD